MQIQYTEMRNKSYSISNPIGIGVNFEKVHYNYVQHPVLISIYRGCGGSHQGKLQFSVTFKLLFIMQDKQIIAYLLDFLLQKSKPIVQSWINEAIQSQQPSEASQYPELMTVKQCADFLDVSAQTIRRHAKNNSIPFTKKFNKLYFFKSDILEHLKSGVIKSNNQIKLEANDLFIQKRA